MQEITKAYSTLAQEFDLLVDERLEKYTSFNVGGPADLLALPENKQDLKHLLKQASFLGIPVSFIGGGSNLLITDKGIRGLVVIMRHLKSDLQLSSDDLHSNSIVVQTGNRLSSVCRFAINQSLSGLEFAAGIPGTLGGAVMMNAGTSTGSMADIVGSIEVMNLNTMEIETIGKKDLDFSYRCLNQPGIVMAATLVLKKGDQKIIEQTYHKNLTQRNATQPSNFASAGCFFKNPDQGLPAGELIEKSGLKGMKINDAMVSEIHANYIVNIGNATCKDILLLKQYIQKTVLDKFHIKLETEVRMEGE